MKEDAIAKCFFADTNVHPACDGPVMLRLLPWKISAFSIESIALCDAHALTAEQQYLIGFSRSIERAVTELRVYGEDSRK